MNQTFERVTERHGGGMIPLKHLYRRRYRTASGDWSTIFYARFTDWKGKRRTFPLGSDLKIAKEELRVLEARNIRREDFDADKVDGLTVSRWSEIFVKLDEVKEKRSLDRDRQHIKHLNRFFGSMLLTDIKREDLFKYKNQRLTESVIRNGKPAKKKVSQGTVSNELSCLRHMLRMASRENVDVSIPSFDGLIKRAQRDRVVDAREEAALLLAYPPWLRRISIVAKETCLSQGDILRLTQKMVDWQRREIVPSGGRVKTGVEQRAPITDRVLEVLEEIERERRRGKIIANKDGLIFTRDDGRAINKDMITQAVRVGRKRAGITDFRFHDYRHSAKTEWSRRGVHVDIAMKAAGHKSVAMHQRYVNLKPGDVAQAFGLATQWQHKNEAAISEPVTP